MKQFFFYTTLFFLFVVSSCKNAGNDADVKAHNLKADSLGIKLNSPELSAKIRISELTKRGIR